MLVKRLEEILGITASCEGGELVAVVERDKIAEVLQKLRDDESCRFEQLVDLCGVDYPERPLRFEVVYNLLSLHYNHRLRVKIEAGEKTPVPTVAGVYRTAAWFEREAWDMFGITFAGNDEQRRILTDYDFDGHPLRKDFPLWGETELRYDEGHKCLVMSPVKLTQEYREYDMKSPWKGAGS